MNIDELVIRCRDKYADLKRVPCENCPNKTGEGCECKSLNCGICFEEMFFKDHTRTFNCPCITYSYVCRYIYQFSTEILYALYVAKEKLGFTFDRLNVWSLGCGPCSEAFAIDMFVNEVKHPALVPTAFLGIDTNSAWSDVHEIIKKLMPFEISTYNGTFMNLIQENPSIEYPNVLILNYIFSDIVRRGGINPFIDDVVLEIINKMPSMSLIIINDINHQDSRDFYKTMEQKMKEKGSIRKKSYYFEGYTYGTKYNKSDLYRNYDPFVINSVESLFGTRKKCSSAQSIIIKE